MECELLAESNLALLLDFIDDMNTKYDKTVLKAFLDEKNAYGYIAVDDENGGEKSVQDERFSLPFVIDKNDMCDTLLFSS